MMLRIWGVFPLLLELSIWMIIHINHDLYAEKKLKDLNRPKNKWTKKSNLII